MLAAATAVTLNAPTAVTLAVVDVYGHVAGFSWAAPIKASAQRRQRTDSQSLGSKLERGFQISEIDRYMKSDLNVYISSGLAL